MTSFVKRVSLVACFLVLLVGVGVDNADASGGYEVSIDASAPAEQWVAGGSTGVMLNVLNFVATSEDIALTDLRLQLDETGSSTGASFSAVRLYDGNGVLLQTKYFPMFTGNTEDFYFPVTGAGSFVIPKDQHKRMYIKADLAPICLACSGVAGQLVGIDYDGDGAAIGKQRGIGLSSGLYVRSSTNVDQTGNGVVTFKSVPNITRIPISETATAGFQELYKFKIAASPFGDVEINKFTFAVATSGVANMAAQFPYFRLFSVTNGNYLTQVIGTTSQYMNDPKNYDSSNRLLVRAVVDSVYGTNYPVGRYVIPAGTEHTFSLVANIYDDAIAGGAVFVDMLGDFARPVSVRLSKNGPRMISQKLVEEDANNSFIWSDISSEATSTANAHSLNTADWMNGFRVAGLQTAGLGLQIKSFGYKYINAPSNLTAVGSTSPNRIELNWQDNSVGELGFRLYRSVYSNFANSIIATSTSPNVTSFTDFNVATSTTYYYMVQAIGYVEGTGYSNMVSVTLNDNQLPAIKILMPSPNEQATSTSFRFSGAAYAQSGVKYVRVSVYDYGRSSWTVNGDIAFLGAKLQNGVRYWYYTVPSSATTLGSKAYLSAYVFDNLNNYSSAYKVISIASSTQPQIPVPQTPSNLKAKYVATSSPHYINVLWYGPSNNEDGFILEKSIYSNFANVSIATTTGPNVWNYQDYNIATSTTYYYRVKAFNAGGSSGYSNTASVSVVAPPFTIGDRIRTTASVNVRSYSSLYGTLLGTQPKGAEGTVIDNPGTGNGYTWWKIDYDTGADGWSVENFIEKVGTSSSPSIPLAPSNLKAKYVATSSPHYINVLWYGPSNNEDGFILEKSIYSNFANVSIATTTGPNVWNYQDYNIATSTTYYYRVKAFNAGGSSGYSNTASATVAIPPQQNGSDADLFVESYKVSPSKPKIGKAMSFIVRVKNQGTENSGASQVALRIDSGNNGIWDVKSVQNVSPISPGKKETHRWRHIWAPRTAGAHRYEICVDWNNALNEALRNNNCVSGVFIVGGGSYSAQPDLYIESSKFVPLRMREGKPVSFSVSVKNQGGLAAVASEARLRIYSEKSGSWDKVATYPIPPLARGSRKSVKWTRVWRASPGVNIYEICADAKNAVGEIAESNEANNCVTGTFVVAGSVSNGSGGTARIDSGDIRAEQLSVVEKLLGNLKNLASVLFAFNGSADGTAANTTAVASAAPGIDALPSFPLFAVNLGRRDSGSEVTYIQQFLGEELYFDGSPTGFFNTATVQAVKDFQEEYYDEILEPIGLTKPTGYWGSATRAKANEVASYYPSATSASQINLLSNGDFEKGKADWSDWGPNKVLVTDAAGNNVLQFTLGANNTRILKHAATAAEAGKTYQVGADITTSGVTGGGIYIEVTWRTAGGRNIGKPVLIGHAMGSGNYKFAEKLTAPAKTGRVRIRLLGVEGRGTATVDNVYFIGTGALPSVLQPPPPVITAPALPIEPKDATPPTVSISYPTSASSYSTDENTIALGMLTSDNVTAVKDLKITWQNTATGASGAGVAGYGWFTPKISLNAGANTIIVKAADEAGNISSDSIVVTYSAHVSSVKPPPPSSVVQPADITPPSIDIKSPTSAYAFTTDQDTVTVGAVATDNVTAAKDLKVTWRNTTTGASGNAVAGYGWFTPKISLNAGANTIVMKAVDAAGNTNSDSIVVTYNVPVPVTPKDATPPTVSISYPTSASSYSTDENTIALGMLTSDNVTAVKDLKITWQNTATGASGAGVAGYGWFTPKISLNAGANTIIVKAADEAGNISSDSIVVTYSAPFVATSTASTLIANRQTLMAYVLNGMENVLNTLSTLLMSLMR